ncbi:MAG: ATP synthase subunit I [Proteobacteria bacterium]|nr:ATP synthase subunit I [Pseudomonadota bacterium]
MLAIELPRARRLAYGVVMGQVLATACAAAVAQMLGGRHAALSALLGGGIAVAGSLAMALVVFAGGAADAHRALGRFYAGEGVKLALVATLFVVVLKSVRVVPLAMFAAFAATFLVYWVALVMALPAAVAPRGAGGQVGQ